MKSTQTMRLDWVPKQHLAVRRREYAQHRPRFVALAALLVSCGCVATRDPVIVELINQTGFDVTPNLFVSADAADAATLFGDDANRVTHFSDRPFPELRGGEIAEIEFVCDSIGALGVSHPLLYDSATLAITNSADEFFWVRSTDFDCGGRVRIYFYREGTALRTRIE